MGLFSNIGNAFKDYTAVGSLISGGGVAGGLSNLLYGKPNEIQQYGIDQSAFMDPNAAKTLAGLQKGLAGAGQIGQNQYTAQQQALMEALQGQATGQTPSVAGQALRQETDRNIQQQMGALASNRGVGAGLAARLAGQQGAQLQQQAVGQGALAQAQEKQMAQQNFANALAQARQGDLSGEQLRMQQQQYYQNALLAKQEADRQARIEQQRLGMQNVQGTQGLAAQSAAQRQQNIGNILSSAGSAAAMFA